MREGVLTAIQAAQDATGAEKVNVIGYCIGGTLTAASLGYMAAQNDTRVNAATFFTTQVDFEKAGDLLVYVDEEQVKWIEDRMADKGYLPGNRMADAFNLLRSNDLIWSFVVNNYLLGKEPFPFDLLYWNSDPTRMPYKMHSFYLRNMYLGNKLSQPGGITLKDTPIDLSKVKTPCYFISTVEDHIAPWKGTYLGAKALGGPVRFVLGGSGHIAGIVNPPAANKYGYWTNDAKALPATSDDWMGGATQHPGSWWTDWQQWITALPGGEAQVAARNPAKGKLGVIEDAQGSYVKVRTGPSAD